MADKPQEKELSPAEIKEQNRAAATKQRKEEINAMPISADEKKILLAYERGDHVYKIAKDIYKFPNQDTVGQVVLTIRRAYADDFNDIEDINSTKGYTGIS